ncbi:MAG: hypothetical protein IMW92_08790 [Bacillales bacterium]|nr:hypothetical protein [Bacillales bacterium]
MVKIIISAGKKGGNIEDFIVQFVSENKSDREYVTSRLIGYFWGIREMGGNISVVKDGEIIADHLMAYAIVDGWESGWEFEIK